MNIVDYLNKYPIPSWRWFFSQENVKRVLEHIGSFITPDTVPSLPLILNPFIQTNFDDLKVIIVGQDPYPCHTLSNGLAFSSHGQVPNTLLNIYSLLEKTVIGFEKPMHGDLSHWAVQGVLLLNSSLTCQAGKSGSHEKIWIPFINLLVEQISTRKSNVVFMLWGKQAQKLRVKIDKKKHYILETFYPSLVDNGFSSCNHFNLANKKLEQNGQAKIDWNLKKYLT